MFTSSKARISIGWVCILNRDLFEAVDGHSLLSLGLNTLSAEWMVVRISRGVMAGSLGDCLMRTAVDFFSKESL